MRRSPDFAVTVRRGRRIGGRRVVVHLLLPHPAGDTAPATAGFVVSKAVGGAVVRTSVKRKLRHLVADRVSVVPAGARLVVRANPAAAQASSAQLGADLDRQLASALAGRERPGTSSP
jgi:ribonuclease P protein component